MGSVWKRIQRVGKQAAKFEFIAQLQSVTLECKKEKQWTPTKLVVLWQRGAHRRKYSRPFNFQPGVAKPYRGVMVWVEPEELDMVCTLYKDEKPGSPFEPKEWQFILLDESSGRRKPLAQGAIDMSKFHSLEPTCKNMTIKMKPANSKVLKAQVDIALSCMFIREGKATDEDMLSVASMMSLNDIDSFDFDTDHTTSSGGGGFLRGTSFRKKRSSSRNNSRPSSLVSDSGDSGSCDDGIVSNKKSPLSRKSSRKKSMKKEMSPLAKSNENHRKEEAREPKESKKKGVDSDLLAWSQEMTDGYTGVKVINMTTSWRDGLAFCALLHRFHPELVEFSKLSSKDIKHNNKLAFDGFESVGVSKLLDANDLVRRSTPDKLTVMTYLHQIKEHFENKKKNSAITSLVSQYKFLTDADDMFLSRIDKKHEAKKSARDNFDGISPAKAEIDSVTDAQEVSSILEQLCASEKRIEVERITQSIDSEPTRRLPRMAPQSYAQKHEKQGVARKPQRATDNSIDEDEALNMIIENRDQDAEAPSAPPEKPTRRSKKLPNLPVKKTPPSSHPNKSTALTPEKKSTPTTAHIATPNATKPADNTNPFLDDTTESFGNAPSSPGTTSRPNTLDVSPPPNICTHINTPSPDTQQNSTTTPVYTRSLLSEKVASNNTEVESNNMEVASNATLQEDCLDKVDTVPNNSTEPEVFSPEKNKQELIQERARKMINESRLKAQEKQKEEEEDRNEKEKDTKEEPRLPDHPSPVIGVIDTNESPAGLQTPPEFKKNPFTLVKKKSLKTMPTKLKDDKKKETPSPTAPLKKDLAQEYAESRKIHFERFECAQKPHKRDVGAEIAAELARMKQQEEDEVEESQAVVEGSDGSEHEATDEEEDEVHVPVDDYFYELENFNLRSAGEYYNCELTQLEKETRALDRVAQKLELELRKAMAAGDKEEEDDLLQEWFNLVNKKNEIIRRQNEVALLAQGDDLETQCELINRELRVLSTMTEAEKCTDHHEREEQLLSQLVMLVNQRNQLVQIEDTHQQQSQHDEEHVQTLLSQQQTRGNESGVVGWVKKGFKTKFW